MNKMLLAICLLALLLVGAVPPPDLPQPPPGCALADYIEWENAPGNWGGWITNSPYQICGIAAKGLGKWHSLFEEDCSTISSNGQTTCTVSFNDGTTLTTKSMLSDNGMRLEGFDISSPGLKAAAIYIPIETQNEQIYKTVLPLTMYDGSLACRPGCIGDPFP